MKSLSILAMALLVFTAAAKLYNEHASSFSTGSRVKSESILGFPKPRFIFAWHPQIPQ